MDYKQIKKKPQLHSGHRARMRQGVINNGWDNLTDHQVLEMLLGMAIPRKDTNEIAHELINRFGSLAHVLDAEISDLVKVDGVGERTAVFIASIRQIMQRYQIEKCKKCKTITNNQDVYDFMGERLKFLPKEEFHVICLSSTSEVIVARKLGSGSNNHIIVDAKDILEIAINCKASGVIIIHNHPSGSLYPSQEDIAVTKSIYMNLMFSGLHLLDHYIFGRDGAFSFVDNSLFDELNIEKERWLRYTQKFMAPPPKFKQGGDKNNG